MPLVPADGRYLRDARHAFESEAKREVLDRPELREVVLSARVAQCILVDPADAGRVGTEHRRHALGQLALDAVHVFEHARARPVDVRPFLEEHVDEGHPEHRVTAHGRDFGRREQ